MARGPFVKEEETQKWKEQLAAGVAITELAKQANRTYNTVKRYLNKPAANDEPQTPNAA